MSRRLSPTRRATRFAPSTRLSSSAVYVPHCFQKKSHQGSQTDKADLDLIRNRLKVAEAAYQKQFPEPKRER